MLTFAGVYYTFTGLRGLLFFTVVILIGTGWSFMNSHVMVEDRTKQVLLLVIPLQVGVLCGRAGVRLSATCCNAATWELLAVN
jgi:hypothetical protein